MIFPILVAVGLSACAVEDPPTIAHTHIGHTLTGWQETPNKVGLWKVAEEEAAILDEHMELALATKDVAGVKEHIRHLIHVLDPDQTTNGPGTGYGMRQAIELGFTHLGFGAEAGDATPNFREFTTRAESAVKKLLENCTVAIEFAKAIRRATNEEEVLILTTEMKSVVSELINGSDRDGDGKVTLGADIIGVYPLRDELNAMIAREIPVYEPISTRWLFGIFRQPDGTWAFRVGRYKRGRGGY